MGDSHKDPDLPLVHALQAGNESALNELIHKYEEPLFRFICRYTGNEESALRLIRALAVEIHEDWIEAHRYLNMEMLRKLNLTYTTSAG
jgi:hypothetical protein